MLKLLVSGSLVLMMNGGRHQIGGPGGRGHALRVHGRPFRLIPVILEPIGFVRVYRLSLLVSQIVCLFV